MHPGASLLLAAAACAGALPAAPVSFVPIAGSGVDLRITNGDPDKPYIVDAMGTGACLLDYDGDGLLDIYVVNGSTRTLLAQGRSPPSALYRNNGDWTFTEVTREAGVPGRGWGQGCTVGDVDNDGHPDLYVTALGPNTLYLNRGDGTFSDVSEPSGTADPRWSTSAAFADLDGDGLLDLYVANYVRFDPAHPPPPHSGTRFYERRVRVFAGPQGLEPAPDALFRGLGHGRFRDVTEEWGALTPHARYGLGVVIGDVDGDGDEDIYVANDSQPNFLFVNQGGGRFVERGLLSGAALSEDGRSQAGMGVAMGDVDGDGREDLFVTNFAEDTNTLYRNLGGGFFRDATREAGLGGASFAELGWGAQFLDVGGIL